MERKDKQQLYSDIWQENEDKIRRICDYKMQSCREEIEDLIADVSLYLWENICNDTVISNYTAWLFAVTNNLIKQRYTSKKVSTQRYVSIDNLDAETEITLQVRTDMLEAIITDSIIEKYCDEIISGLSEEEQKLLDMVYEQNLKYKEIAALMGINESSVKQRKYRLCRKIHKIIEKYLNE